MKELNFYPVLKHSYFCSPGSRYRAHMLCDIWVIAWHEHLFSHIQLRGCLFSVRALLSSHNGAIKHKFGVLCVCANGSSILRSYFSQTLCLRLNCTQTETVPATFSTKHVSSKRSPRAWPWVLGRNVVLPSSLASVEQNASRGDWKDFSVTLEPACTDSQISSERKGPGRINNVFNVFEYQVS